MQTSFTLAQLMDPQVVEAEKILRACVHCGFCTATCPTYVLLGDELDSPRGRIYLIKEMLERDQPATREVVKHIDRCLSCLACMTTCPSGVHYMHLVDHAREHIEKTYKRPLFDRAMHGLLARVLPDLGLFRLALVAALVARPFAPVLNALGRKISGLRAILRTTVPASFFQSRLAIPWELSTVQQDVGCIQQGPLMIDVDATWREHARFHATWNDRIQAEIEAMSQAHPNLVLADTPYLAIAAAPFAGSTRRSVRCTSQAMSAPPDTFRALGAL